MNIMAELAIIFGVCLLAEGIAAILPVAFPASVISLILLLLLLLSGIIKDRHIGRVSRFFVGNMAFFFVPPCVGILEHTSTLAACLIPFLVIAILTTPLVYCATAWTIQLMLAARRRKEARHD